MVELVFDNSDKTFGIDSEEVAIKRIVRKNGQSIYKINGNTKARQDIIELMAQGGIDPNGFNIVLQGEIQSLVNATPEERRKIIEEVAGISIYETRKQKSQKELEKTDEKLKEVSSVLKERASYLKNLDKERQDAISYKKLDNTIKRCKATLISKTKKIKEKEKEKINKDIDDNNSKIARLKKQVDDKNFEIEKLRAKILVVNKQIQFSTSNEQEGLHREISDLRAELAGLEVRRENFENRILQDKDKTERIKKKIEELNLEMSRIQIASPEIKEKQKQQKTIQEKFDILEKQRREFYILKSDLSTLENEKSQKEKFIIESSKEIQLIEQTVNSLVNEIKYSQSISESEKLKERTVSEINKISDKILDIEKDILEREKRNAIFGTDIKREEKLKSDILRLKSCPVCKQNVGYEHKNKISSGADEKIKFAEIKMKENLKSKEENSAIMKELKDKLTSLRIKLNEIDIDQIKLRNSAEKKEQIGRILENQKEAKTELSLINEKIHSLKKNYNKLKDVEEEYDEVRLLLQEISFNEVDVDTEITIKKRDRKSVV